MRSISILGATGSVGASTLDLIRSNPDEWRVEALTANCNVAELAALAREFGAKLAVVADERYRMPDDDLLLRAYQGLVEGRRINDQAYALVRQGRMAVYPSSHGQEACQVGAVLALGERDWLFPTYRDSVALVTRGVPAAT